MLFLITGGAGFIGAALANHLVAHGHSVRVLDDLTSGDPNALDSRVLFTRGDVRDIPKLWSLLRGVDVVYHLAARVSVPESILYPVEYNSVNVGGTVALMTAVRDARVPRVILTSSGAAYGEQVQLPVKETATLRPSSPYAVSKLASEYYLNAIGALWNIETVSLRIFNAYGPNQNLPPSHAPVIPRFIQQALLGGSIVVFGNGEQSRDFIYIDDVVNALERAGIVPDLNRAIVNIGSGVECTVSKLVSEISLATHRHVHRLINPSETGGVSRLVADVSLASSLLGWEPRVSLQEGLASVIDRDPRFKPIPAIDT